MGLLDKLFGKSDTHSKNTRSKPVKKTSKSTSGNTSSTNKYRAVEIVVNDANGCQAAKALTGQRFLAESTPMLPLSDCDAASCKCTYKRFSDRRGELRRTADVKFDVEGQFRGDNRRSDYSSGRREDD